MVVSAFMDESGKFQNPLISLAGVAGNQENLIAFYDAWGRELKANGLRFLTMKDALNHKRPLSAKVKMLGVANRTMALLPFARAIRHNLQSVFGMVFDVQAFRKTPSHLRRVWSDDPIYMAFTVNVLALMQPLRAGVTVSIICDDEEKTALPMYRLYRRIKLLYPPAKETLTALAFADDKVFHALQAADFVSSLARLEAARQFHGQDYEYQTLWDDLGDKQPEDAMWACNVNFADSDGLTKLSIQMLQAAKERKLSGHSPKK
jgi:hypothetical protein